MKQAVPLDALRPLHAPPPIPWWPPAPGWWLLAGLLLAALLALLWWRRRTRLQRAALRELDALVQSGGPAEKQLAALNRLLKRYALACWPHSEVASLNGKAWLAFLDAHGGGRGFSEGPGQALLIGPYSTDTKLSPELVGLARRWIRTNQPGRAR